MDYNDLLRAVVILTCMGHIHAQYYDFLQAFQPFVQPQPNQPLGFLNDFTTRRPKPKQKIINDVRHVENGRKLERIPLTDNEGRNADKNKQTTRRKPTNAFDLNFFITTQRPTRKTTKAPDNNLKTPNRQDSKSSAIIFFDDGKYDPRPPSRESAQEKPKPRPANRKPQNQYETVYDGRTSYTTRRPYETTKTYQQSNKKTGFYTTHNPLLHRPGVKPAVTHGPPITNRPITQRPVTQKPITQRPSFDNRPQVFDDDLNVSPEVISGPDEDFMSAVERKRYIELAERMCDKYKSLNTKQVEAIPLLPSPQPVRVNVSSCPPTTVPLVVGGKVVSVKEFPHMALLGWRKKTRGYSWKCGGTLVSNQYILTAAHCAYQDRDENLIPGPPRIVQLGSSFLNDPKAVLMKVSSVTRHPKYKIPKAYYDLAIVKMAGTVTFSDMIKPACLGTPPPANNPIIATGWGTTEFGGSLSHELRSVSIPVWDINDCYTALGVSAKIPQGPSSESQICAGERRGGKDTCQGDSGGPAQIQDGCIWRVVAVTSVGRYCGAADTPAIYAIVQRAFVSAVVFGKESQNNRNNNDNRFNDNRNNNREDNLTTNLGNNDWNKKRNEQTSTQRPIGTNEWNRKPNNTGIEYGNNRENYNWNTERDTNYNQGSYPTNIYNSGNRNTNNNNNYNNYNVQTTENYGYSNPRRDNDFYNPPRTDQFYNNYAGNNNFNNYKQQDYASDGRSTYYNGDGNVWWT